MVNCYLFFLKKKLSGIFNVGFENYPIYKIAKLIKKNIHYLLIKRNNLIDVRSYRLFSGRLLSKGFKPLRNTEFAIMDLIKSYKSKKIINRKTNFRSIYLSKYLKKESNV